MFRCVGPEAKLYNLSLPLFHQLKNEANTVLHLTWVNPGEQKG